MTNRVFVVFTISNKIPNRGVVDEDYLKVGNGIYTIETLHEHKEGKHPIIGWEILTFIEAKADGANQCLAGENYEGAHSRISEIIKVTRRIIERRKKQGVTLEHRCEYPDWERSKCKKYPALQYQGKYYCDKHLKILHKGEED